MVDAASGAGVDLVLRNLTAPASIVAGSRFDAIAWFANEGDTTGTTGFTIEFRLDGATVSRQTFPPGIPAGWNGSTGASIVASGVGSHVLEAVIDADGNQTESDETNNARALTLHVVAAPRVAARSLELRPVMVPTEAGPVRHPLGRHEATLTTCNVGASASGFGMASFVVSGGRNGTLSAGQSTLSPRQVPALAVGACATISIVFDTPGVVGDFTLTATVSVPFDDPSDNRARASGFRVVGDQGGVAVLATSPTSIDPQPTVGSLQGSIENALQAASRQANATRSAARNQTDALLAGNVTDTAETLACAANLAVCHATHGDPQSGAIRPCSPQSHNPGANLAPFFAWYVVQSYERRELFTPNGTGPVVTLWPFEPTPLPIPAAAPSACRNLWDDARTVLP